jgi:putative hemolysin
MSTILFEILFIVVLILLNGVFAMAELAILSARKVRLQQRAEDGDSGAVTALKLADHPTRFLSTVQIGITLVGVLAGAMGGAGLAGPLGVWIGRIPFFANFAQELAVVLVVGLTTFFTLVAGELLPKRLALAYAEKIAISLSRPMNILAKIGTPIVLLLDTTTNLLMRGMNIKKENETTVTQEELKVLLQEGTKEGVFEQAETSMVEGVLRLGDRLVSAIMTPRTDIEWIDLDERLENILSMLTASPHSHFPLARGSLDDLVGIVRAKDVFATKSQTVDVLSSLAVPTVYLPESTPALAALEQLRAAPGNLAIVIDEFGGVLGMVTLFDAMEAVIGVISMEGKPPAPQAVKREDGSWLVDGMMPIDQLKEIIDVDELPDENRIGYQTVAGFMLAVFKEIPQAGQSKHFGGWRFEIIDMDGLRIDKVLVDHDTD